MARLSRKSLGQRNVEDGQPGAFNNEELVIHRETLPEADWGSYGNERFRGAERSHHASKRNRPANTPYSDSCLILLTAF